MRLLLLFLINCAVIPITKPKMDPNFQRVGPKSSIQSVYFVLHQESMLNGKKGDLDYERALFIHQIEKDNPNMVIEKSLEKAELILEIETDSKRTYNRILPFFAAITLTIVPFYQELEMSERFRVLDKKGEIIFQSSRKQNLDYWFGLFFAIKGMIQFADSENINRTGFEQELLLKMNREILKELDRKNISENK